MLNSCSEATLDSVVIFPSSSIIVFFFLGGKSQLFVKLGTSQFVKSGGVCGVSKTSDAGGSAAWHCCRELVP